MDHNGKRLTGGALHDLRELVTRMDAFRGPWGTARGGERLDDGSISMPWIDMDRLVYEAMTFLYNNDLIVRFDWGAWDEGRAIFHDPAPDRFDHLDRETVLKLLSAVARNDRFNEGAWASLFEDGDAQQLFRRLLEIEPESS